jgi:hypothetical protein
MNLQKALLSEHSKAQTIKIVHFIGDNPERFKELMHLFFDPDYRTTQRAAWVMSGCVQKHPSLVTPYLNKMINNLRKPVHDAVKRNTVRVLQHLDLPDKLMGKTADICFELLSTPSEAIAIKAFSMTVLLNITKKQPDLKNELRILIEDQIPYASAGFLSRAKKTLKELDKLVL